MKRKEEEKEEIFFINVIGVDDLRRELLESSRTIIEALKNYERFKSANKEKQKEIENLKAKVNEVSKLAARLRSALPSVKLGELKKRNMPVKEAKQSFEKPETELDRLEDDLNEIESKIDSLS